MLNVKVATVGYDLSALRKQGLLPAVGDQAPQPSAGEKRFMELYLEGNSINDIADDTIRPGDYVLLDPDEGRHYGGRNAKRLTARVSASLLEYRQGDEFIFVGDRVRRAAVSR